ncbi:MAG: hypothetical protein OQL09_06480, partial [Gammaproteobacteria bacterium]|nr:hypothetical protein [Gammaproteobacteria bacterium]
HRAAAGLAVQCESQDAIAERQRRDRRNIDRARVLLAVADGQLLSPLILTLALVVWVVAPFSIAVWLFSRRKH